MKNKRNTGLRAGVYQESSDQKSTLFDLLASVLIFLALAAIGYTISGFAAMLYIILLLASRHPGNEWFHYFHLRLSNQQFDLTTYYYLTLFYPSH